MANATSKVSKAAYPDWKFWKRSSATLAAATRFYTRAMLGLTTGGYLAKMDDTQSLLFVGLVRGREGDPLLPAGTAADGTIDIDYECPERFELAISGIAVGDIGKKVYASDDKTGVLTNGGTYGNCIGTVEDITGVSGIAIVKPMYDGLAGNARLNVAKTLAATGAVTLTKWDLNKIILLPTTSARAVTLPAVADTQAGDRLTFIKTTSNAVIDTLTGAGAETIDGSNTLGTIDAQFDTAILVSTGSVWVVLARDIS